MNELYHTSRVRWRHFSVNIKSLSVKFIMDENTLGRNKAKARLIRIKSSRVILMWGNIRVDLFFFPTLFHPPTFVGHS